ncbi:MAG: class I SAM-dependent methyltransferase [Methanobacteriota archaeon]|nr:MAG: class I SAM-dependent methyltransferase [Euryarchaeota archaeon]
MPKNLESSGALDIAKKLGSISGGRVLDVGTGQGGFIDTLMNTLKDYESFVGIDNGDSHDSVKGMRDGRAHFMGKPVEFLWMDGKGMGFEDGSFDTVCISYGLHHLEDVDAVLTDMRRVLRPGGRFIIQELYCEGDKTEAQRVDRLQHEWCTVIDNLLGMTHNKAFTRQRLLDFASYLGLKDLEVFDSDRPMDCLFCEMNQLCEDPRNQAEFYDLMGRIDETHDRIKDYPDPEVRDRIKEEGEVIKKAIAGSGSAASSYLFMVGTG